MTGRPGCAQGSALSGQPVARVCIALLLTAFSCCNSVTTPLAGSAVCAKWNVRCCAEVNVLH